MNRALSLIAPFALIGLLLAIWEAACRALAIPPFLLPPPSAIAMAVGVRADSWHRAVPSRTREVRDPHQASGVSASDPYASAVHTESKPSLSASSTSSAVPTGGCAPQ